MVCHMALHTCRSANHHNIIVISGPAVPYSTSLVWYAHFILTVTVAIAIEIGKGNYGLPCKSVPKN